jgi:protein-L-isoaspartate(D-aspartate) O-methyltransferase
LEVGTGSGYATAVLSRLVREVVSVERFKSLAAEAAGRLQHAGVTNVKVIWGDGLNLAPGTGPFDRILLNGSLAEIPVSVLRLLAQDGVLLMGRPDPVSRTRQDLVAVERGADGGLVETRIASCRMQPLMPGVAQGL